MLASSAAVAFSDMALKNPHANNNDTDNGINAENINDLCIDDDGVNENDDKGINDNGVDNVAVDDDHCELERVRAATLAIITLNRMEEGRFVTSKVIRGQLVPAWRSHRLNPLNADTHQGSSVE